MTRLKLVLLAAATPLAFAAPAEAQMNHSGMRMPGMSMPMPAKRKPPAARKKAPPKHVASARREPAKARPRHRAARPVARMPATNPGTPHDMANMPGMPAGHDMASMPGMTGGVRSQVGQDPPPTSRTAASKPAPAGHDMASMPGMQAPGADSAPAEHDMSSMPGMAMPEPAGSTPLGHDMGAMEGHGQAGTSLPAGNAPAPPMPTDHAADQVYGPAEMAMARHHLKQHGGQKFSQVIFNLAEYQAHKGGDGFNWDAEAWYGSDIGRLWLKSEGEGAFREGVERAEIQVLYSRAIGPYFNLQGGLRYDFRPNPSRVYAAIGVEGLAPSFFEVESFLFLSNNGEVLGRLGGYYDQRITQRLILQPRAELNFSAQDVPETGLGNGLTDSELGLRLRYDIGREFAPYLGVEYQRTFGDTARFRRAAGEPAAGWNFVMGVRAWF